MTKKNSGWTIGSYECYDNNSQCSERCSNYWVCQKVSNNFKKIPPMKICVEELIEKNYAIPVAVTDSTFNTLPNYLIQTLKLWVIDNLDDKAIALELKVPEMTVYNYRKKLINFFSYGMDYSYCDNNQLDIGFANWAKVTLAPEIEKLERLGVYLGA